ncbi:MAG: ATP-binding protein, partial [Bacteroidia bacterium]|nr:ATP-binding protein [Bacteroidia bacterium]
MPEKEYTLILNSSRESVNMLESFLDEVITEEFEPLYGNIYMAVSETLSNAIIHGNKEDAAKRVVLSCIASAQQLRFTIQDEG